MKQEATQNVSVGGAFYEPPKICVVACSIDVLTTSIGSKDDYDIISQDEII